MSFESHFIILPFFISTNPLATLVTSYMNTHPTTPVRAISENSGISPFSIIFPKSTVLDLIIPNVPYAGISAVLNTSIKLAHVESFSFFEANTTEPRLTTSDAAGMISAIAFMPPGITERKDRNFEISSAVSRCRFTVSQLRANLRL